MKLVRKKEKTNLSRMNRESSGKSLFKEIVYKRNGILIQSSRWR